MDLSAQINCWEHEVETLGKIDELKFPGTATHTDTYTYDIVVVDRVDSTMIAVQKP